MSKSTKYEDGISVSQSREVENLPAKPDAGSAPPTEKRGRSRVLAPTRRSFLKSTTALGAAGAAYWLGARLMVGGKAYADALPAGGGVVLSDPADQPKFVELAPNALDPGFKFVPRGRKHGWTKNDWDEDDDWDDDDWDDDHPDSDGHRYKVKMKQVTQQTGLLYDGQRAPTKVWGYGSVGKKGPGVSWPGPTFEVKSKSAGGGKKTIVKWRNKLPKRHLLPVDENLHWCFSLHGASSANGVDYTQFSIAQDGVPAVPHLHGGNSDFQYDGNPEFFWTRTGVAGPQWDSVPGGFTQKFVYNNDVPAGNLWYHDHALGITRLNVYAGLAGFYFVRDEYDTGKKNNPLGLPAGRYELAYAIQDRMFEETGELFYPAFPDDPFYDDFIDGDVTLPDGKFPGGGPTALAEFFGDHMVVNGKIWPKTDVEPRNYRMHLLNGCDSRFLVIQFVAVDAGVTDPEDISASAPIDFWAIGSDQGLGTPSLTNTLVVEPGSRYDIVFDFDGLKGKRVIMKNIGWDAPFGGEFGGIPDPADVFANRQTDRIMAFDVTLRKRRRRDRFDVTKLPNYQGIPGNVTNTRRVALFEGRDEFGRLQPLLGTVQDGDLSGDNVATALTWFQPTTEMPDLDSTEIWEIYNFTGDAHPIHLHLVNFEVIDKSPITFVEDPDDVQEVLQHNGETGMAAQINNIEIFPAEPVPSEYYETAPRDMVTVLPEQRVRIKMHFNKPGRYVWHCHILSHEDHEMMRVLEVIGEPDKKKRRHKRAKTRHDKWRPWHRRHKRHSKKRYNKRR